MMLTRIQKGSNIYVVYELDAFQPQIDKISFMMINSNQQHNIGLAPITFEEMNGIYHKMLFDVTGKVTLREYIGKHISQEDFRLMLLNLIDTIEQFDEYMIDVNQILLDMDCVYINAIDHSIAFLCIALKDVTQTYRPYEFFRAVVQNSYVNLNMNEVSYFNHIWNITSNENGFSLSNMKAAMKTTQESKPQSKPQAGEPVQDNSKDIPRIEEPKEITVSQPKYTPPSPKPVPASDSEEQKGSGFLGKLFSTSLLRKNNQSKKKKPAPTGYQGGLAGLKNGIGRTGSLKSKQTQENPTEVQNFQQISANQMNQQTVPKQSIYQGTTVLKGKMPDYLSEQSGWSTVQETVQQAIPETTVLNQKTHNPVPEIPETTVLNKKIQQTEPEIPETTVLNKKVQATGIPETTVLKPAPKKTACLIQLRENRLRFFVNKPVFVIGRGVSGIDCAVNDNTNVSRHHAEILQSGSEYFLSVITQHEGITYLNGAELKSGARVRLSDGDKILLGDEEFEFRIA